MRQIRWHYSNHTNRNSPLDIDPANLYWPRTVNINDRALREIIVGANEKSEGFPHRSRFVLTEASEVMAILSLSYSLKDMRERLGRIIVALNKKGGPVTAEDVKCAGAMAVLLRDALRPNLLQTSEGTPAFVHTGPFANIAPGISSLIADQLALSLADYVITEAGFGADLGFEKLIDMKCRVSDLYPDCAVLVVTLNSIKAHGGYREGGTGEIEKGMEHLQKQIENVRVFGVPLVIALNRHEKDREDEVRYLIKCAESLGVNAVPITPWKDGGVGAEALARAVEEITIRGSEESIHRRFLYDLNIPVEDKIKKIAVTMYGAKDIEFSEMSKEK